MELEQLRHFVEVVERMSFTRAASFLGVNQPLLSRQIRRLETEMRTVLLIRTGRGVRPTEAGIRLAATARNILRQLDLAANSVSEVDDQLQGTVVVGLPPSLGRVVSVPFIRAFTSRFPKAKAIIVEGLSRTLSDALLNSKVDIAVLHDQKASSSIELTVIATESLCLVSPPNEKIDSHASISFEDVVRYPLIFPCAPNPIRRIVEQAAIACDAPLDIRWEVDGIDAILQLVMEGFGSAIAGASIVAKTRYAGVLPMRRIVQPTLRTKIMLARPVRSQIGVLYERAARLMKETVVELLAEDVNDNLID